MRHTPEVERTPDEPTPHRCIPQQLPALAVGAAVKGARENWPTLAFRGLPSRAPRTHIAWADTTAPTGVGRHARPYHISPMCGRYASFLQVAFIARLFATVNPLPNLAIQDRMPVIIERQDWPLWPGEADGDPSPLCPTP